MVVFIKKPLLVLADIMCLMNNRVKTPYLLIGLIYDSLPVSIHGGCDTCKLGLNSWYLMVALILNSLPLVSDMMWHMNNRAIDNILIVCLISC
jgi:uncharacterized transporter YbjL